MLVIWLYKYTISGMLAFIFQRSKYYHLCKPIVLIYDHIGTCKCTCFSLVNGWICLHCVLD